MDRAVLPDPAWRPFLRRFSPLLLAAFACVGARSQCNVVSMVSIGAIDCSGYDVVVQFFGSPTMTLYAYAIYTDDGQYLSEDMDPNGYTYHVPWTNDPLITNINVTAFDDVNGCQTMGTWSGFLERPPMDLQYSLTLDCNSGLRTLRWTNANTACGNAGDHTYLVNGNGGTISSGFTQESASVWRYNTQLLPGVNTFGIDVTQFGYPGYDCGNSLQCWAMSMNGLVTLNTPSVTPGDCGVNFRIKALLDGAYTSGSMMSDALRAANLIPTTQPYTGLGYTYTGSPTNLTIQPGQLNVTGADAIVDWVVVELRNASTPATVVYSKPALIQRDGDVVDTDGASYINAPVTAGNYHVALRHRNHLGVMTGAPVNLTVDPANTLIDFRSQAQAAYGTSARVLKSGNYCLWAGDANGDGVLKYTGANNDRDAILLAIGGVNPNAQLNNVYDRRDVIMDGTIKYTGANNDRDPILVNIGGVVPTNTRTQQLP